MSRETVLPYPDLSVPKSASQTYWHWEPFDVMTFTADVGAIKPGDKVILRGFVKEFTSELACFVSKLDGLPFYGASTSTADDTVIAVWAKQLVKDEFLTAVRRAKNG